MIKLLIGGSPCTYWSIAQKNNRETKAEGLGWELFKNYLIAKEKFKPDFFLYENNKSAAQAIKDQIKKELKVWDGTLFMEDSGARYIEINSALVSAQNRQRFYVHNCGEVEQPEDRGILLKDILENGIPVNATADEKCQCVRATCYKDGIRNMIGNNIDRRTCVAQLVKDGEIGKGGQGNRIYSIDGKSVSQTAMSGGIGSNTGLYAVPVENVGSSCATTIFEKTDKPIYEVKDGKSRTIKAQYQNSSIANFITNGKHQATGVAEVIRIPPYGNDDKSRPVRASYAYKGAGVGSLQSKCFPDNPNKQVSDYIAEPVRVGALPRPNGELSTSQAFRVYDVNAKSVTMNAGGGGAGGKTGLYAVPVENVGNCKTIQKAITKLVDKYGYLPEQFNSYNLAEITDKSPTLSTGSMVTSSCATTIFEKTDKPIYEVKDGKITIKGKQYPIKLADGYYIIRKLTVTECARLQTMPDDYCKYGREISKQIFNRGNDKWQNAELKDVITKSQIVATDCATSIVYDCKDTELRNLQEKMLIEIKNAKLTVVKENAKAMRATVLCTTSGGKDMELSNCLKGILSNAKFAVRLQLQKDCVQSIIKISKNTETQDTLITYEAVLTNMDTKNINTRITKLNIEPLLKKCSVDNSQKMILSTILTLISQTMMNATCIYVPKANTVDYIMNLKNVQQNCIEWELLSLKTDTIDLMSASQSYKGLGNGWTAEVIIHILNGALKNVPKDEEIVVLSMYDGIGTGRYCLDKMGFTNVKYYAYEIDKYAKQIAMSNYPDIIQMGDAFDLRKDEWRLY